MLIKISSNMKTKYIKFISKKALMLFVALLFTFPFLKAQNWQIEPDEYLVIAFEDSTGAKDTVIVGFYDDGIYHIFNGVATPGIDTVFGEINMPVEQEDTFAARSVRYDGGPCDNYWGCDFEDDFILKIDIRPNNPICYYTTVIDDNDFYIEFYNAVNPIIAKIQVFQPGYECGSEDPSGCFCAEYKNWMRKIRYNEAGSTVRKYYDGILIDTIYLQYPEFDDVGLIVSVSGSYGGESNKQIFTDKEIYINYNSIIQTLVIESEDQIEIIYIYDLQGQILKTISDGSENLDINLSYLKPGIYFVNVYGKKKYYHYKFVKP